MAEGHMNTSSVTRGCDVKSANVPFGSLFARQRVMSATGNSHANVMGAGLILSLLQAVGPLPMVPPTRLG